jgi:hypothetical protein
MTRIGLVGFALLFVSKLCFAGPITFAIDFWGSDPVIRDNNVVSAVYDGHIVLGGETDSTGKVISLSDGTISFKGHEADFHPLTFGFNDYSTYPVGSGYWDWMTGGLTGTYVNAAGILTEAWAHFEGPASVYRSTGKIMSAEGFIYAEPGKWRAAYATVVGVPEPTSLLLLMMGGITLVLRRVRAAQD